MKSFVLLISTTVLVLGCGANDFLSRGEKALGGGGLSNGFGKPSQNDFDDFILPLMDRDCARCHANKTPNYAEALKYITPGIPTKSILYRAAIGMEHIATWAADTEEALILASWIRLEDLRGSDEDLPSEEDFNNVILPSLEKDCALCHANKTPDYATALKWIEAGIPSKSRLYNAATGINHFKKGSWKPDFPQAENLARWIRLEELE